jgi:hypothetical protein
MRKEIDRKDPAKDIVRKKGEEKKVISQSNNLPKTTTKDYG